MCNAPLTMASRGPEWAMRSRGPELSPEAPQLTISPGPSLPNARLTSTTCIRSSPPARWGILKAKTQDFNNVFVSRSADAGIALDATVLVFAEPLFSANVNVFPAIAVDPRERQRLCHLVERELRRYQCPLFLFRGWRACANSSRAYRQRRAGKHRDFPMDRRSGRHR